jgi:Lipase (class 2)
MNRTIARRGLSIVVPALVLLAVVASGCAPGLPEDEDVDPDVGEAPTALGAVTQGLTYGGGANQFAGGFAPRNAPYGGFGGGACTAVRAPVIFVHGNKVNSLFFDEPNSAGGLSAYDTLKAAGYNDCELFGLTWLAPSEQGAAAEPLNYHTATKAARIRDFIQAVKAYTGKSKVQVIAHSMGVSVAAHGITYGSLWGSIDTFINVAGGLRGLSACLSVGYANPLFPTCGSQNLFDSNTFGFWPDGSGGAANPRTGSSTSVGLRHEPQRRTAVRFFTIGGGSADTIVGGAQCRYEPAPALKAQLNVAIDHLSTLTNTGALMNNMLTTSCTGTGCCAGYAGSCIAL